MRARMDDRGLRGGPDIRAGPGGRDPTAFLESVRSRGPRLPDRPDPLLPQSRPRVQGPAAPGGSEVRGADALPEGQWLPGGEPGRVRGVHAARPAATTEG